VESKLKYCYTKRSKVWRH